jgi:glucose/arabinose dehydrogenase
MIRMVFGRVTSCRAKSLRSSSRVAMALVAVIAIACGETDSPPQPDPGSPSGDVQVRPGARLGWLQEAADAAQAASFQYALYVDGIRSTLTSAACTPTSTVTRFDCTAAFPALTAGRHTLELAAFVIDGGVTLESARSSPLQVVMAGLAGSPFSQSSSVVVTAEQVRLNLALVAEGLVLPTDLAFAPDGSILVAERGGTLRTIRDGVLLTEPALDLSNEVHIPEGGLLAVALDGRASLLYALYATAPRSELEFTLARFRAVNGMFAERAILLDRVPASSDGASGTVRLGPDGKLYVAFDSSSDARVAGSFASYNGKVLRLNHDATTPDDQAGFTPIFSLDHPQPTALAWQPGSETLWVIDRVGGDDGGRLSAVSADDPRQKRAAFRTSYALPAGTGALSAAFYRGTLMPMFQNNLFIAAGRARDLMRLRFEADNATRVVTVERLLHDGVGMLRVVAEGSDGALYIANDSGLYRLAP